MKAADFRKTIDELHERLVALTATKGEEYKRADDNQFANFERGAAALGMTREQVLWVYASKHLDSIITYIKDSAEGRERQYAEPITGRIDDVILYMLLLRGMVAKPTQAEICEAFGVEVTTLQDKEPVYIDVPGNRGELRVGPVPDPTKKVGYLTAAEMAAERRCICDGSGTFMTPTSGRVPCPAPVHRYYSPYRGPVCPPVPEEAGPTYIHARVPRADAATAAPEVTDEAIEAVNVLRKRAFDINPFVNEQDARLMFPYPGELDWVENPCRCGNEDCDFSPQRMATLRVARDEVLSPSAVFLRHRTGAESRKPFPDIKFREQPQGAIVTSLDGLQSLVFQWAEGTFGPDREKAAWMKFFEELGEVIKNPEDELEWADLQILFLDLAEIHKVNLTRAIHRKLDINKHRAWTEKNGVMVHVAVPHQQV